MSKQHLDIQNLIFGLSSNAKSAFGHSKLDILRPCRMSYVLSLSNVSDSTVPFLCFYNRNIFSHWYTEPM